MFAPPAMRDDTVLNKIVAHKIKLVSRQFSGNVLELIKGIGLVNSVYANLETGRCCVID